MRGRARTGVFRAHAAAGIRAGRCGCADSKGPGNKCDPEFADIIPECTNLSVGYFDQHSVKERQDIKFLEDLANALRFYNPRILAKLICGYELDDFDKGNIKRNLLS